VILGVGIDLIEIDRFKAALGRHEDRFVARVFTAGERKYCDSRAHRHAHYAARFAAKEAVLKALGTGWSGGIKWSDVEVVHTGKSHLTGPVGVKLTGIAARVAKKLKVKTIHLSITHAQRYASAVAIAEG
jgi:holo-[acyl-carrier protein] synthase